MYNPLSFVETRPDVLHAFIRANPLGTMVTNGPDGPEATHLPMFLDADSQNCRLRCHMARANPHWRLLQSDARVLVIFAGAGHYITPNWYTSKREHGKVVPTWNYLAVHARGGARAFEDTPSLLGHVAELTDSQEAPLCGNPGPCGMLPRILWRHKPKPLSASRLRWRASRANGNSARTARRPTGRAVIAGLDALGPRPPAARWRILIRSADIRRRKAIRA